MWQKLNLICKQWTGKVEKIVEIMKKVFDQV
jgi:hypothetical protein